MGKQEEKSPHGPAELHPYLALFIQHLAQLRDHLDGILQQHASVPSIIGGVPWTSEEKDLFFHALSIYSRFRPDLLAGYIGTKNEVEVMEYLALLEDELRNQEIEEPFRKKLPFAHEVSDSWILWEEENAERLQVNEEIWAEESRMDMVKEVRGSGASAGHAGHVDDVSSDLASFGEIERLTYGHLYVLNSMLKDDGKQQSKCDEVVVSSVLDANTQSAQSRSEVGSVSPTQMLQQDASRTVNDPLDSDSLGNSAPSLSQPDADLDQEENKPTLLQDLTPRARRRYQKRIYMRRKRAQTKGREVDLTVENLRSGRRKKLIQDTLSGSGTENVHGQDMHFSITGGVAMSETLDPVGDGYQTGTVVSGQDSVDDGPLFAKATDARVLYKAVRSSFVDHNVTSETIKASGLDIFNHLKLGKLLRQFISNYDSSLPSEDASISVTTVHLLSEILKDFLVQVMSRVVALEEEHRRLRGTTKVWRKNIDETQNGIIDISAIQFALKTMGIVNENTNMFFADLLGEKCDPVSHYQTGYDDNKRLVNSQNILHQHPLHQDLCPPHCHYISQQGHTRPGLPSEDVDDLMDVDTDEEKLTRELEEEEALDKEDAVADRKHEQSLWKEVPPPRKKTGQARDI